MKRMAVLLSILLVLILTIGLVSWVRSAPETPTSEIPSMEPSASTEEPTTAEPTEGWTAEGEGEVILEEPIKTSTPTPLPKIEVKWKKKDSATKIPKAEEGLYKGTIQNLHPTSPIEAVSASPTEEGRKFAKQILPNPKDDPVFLAIARDSNNKNIMLAGINIFLHSKVEEIQERGEDLTGRQIIMFKVHLVLSLDGGKSWKEINLPLKDVLQIVIEEVRVAASDSSVLLLVSSGHDCWWQAILPLKDSLP